MTIDAFVQYFSDSEWLAQFLTSFVTLFIPMISIIASLIGKYKNSASKSLKEFKEQYENEIKKDMELIKQQYDLLEKNLIELYKQLEEVKLNSAKNVAITGIAYANSNLSVSTKNEIASIINKEEVKIKEVTEQANKNIAYNEELDKVEVPETLEEIAKNVEANENEQNNVVL